MFSWRVVRRGQASGGRGRRVMKIGGGFAVGRVRAERVLGKTANNHVHSALFPEEAQFNLIDDLPGSNALSSVGHRRNRNARGTPCS